MKLILRMRFLAVAFFLGGTAQAQEKCRDALKDSFISSYPLELRYLSRAGATRFYRDGNIWQLRNNSWVSIGTGSYANNTVYESNLAPADLRPLRNFELATGLYQASRFYPNVNGNAISLVKRVQIGHHVIEIQAPEQSNLHQHVEGVYQTLLELPLKRIEAIKVIRLNTRDSANDDHWRRTLKNFSYAGASASGGEIDIFGRSLDHFRSSDNEAHRLLRHEFGHTIASALFGRPNPSNDYALSASQDAYYVSDYGNNNWAEDFAEAIEVYLRTNAGSFSPHLRSRLRNRFAFLDDVFSDRMPQSERPKIYVKIISESLLVAIAPDRGLGIFIDLH